MRGDALRGIGKSSAKCRQPFVVQPYARNERREQPGAPVGAGIDERLRVDFLQIGHRHDHFAEKPRMLALAAECCGAFQRIRKRERMSYRGLDFYDRLVPVLRLFDKLPLPVGLSLWAVAKTSGTASASARNA